MFVQTAATLTERACSRNAPARFPSLRANGSPIPWWLWPHVVSLDAPLVAILWQWWFARGAHVRLPWFDPCILGLGVWLIYLTDRLADAASAGPDNLLTSRHAFHARWRVALSITALSIAAALALMTPHLLSLPLFIHGLWLLCAAGAYFSLTHGLKNWDWKKYLPKEVAVSSLFATGTVFFPWSRGMAVDPWMVAAAAMFGGLCFCNCALITVWERHAEDLRDHTSLLNAFPRLSAGLRWLCLFVAFGAVGGLMSNVPGLFLPLILSGFCLALLDAQHARLPPNLVRVLADVALLTPIIGVFFKHW